MRALTWPLVIGQIPPAVRMRCALARRRRKARISVSAVILALAWMGLCMVMDVSPTIRLFRRVRRRNQKPKFADQSEINFVRLGKERAKLHRIQIFNAKEQIAHAFLKL